MILFATLIFTVNDRGIILFFFIFCVCLWLLACTCPVSSIFSFVDDVFATFFSFFLLNACLRCLFCCNVSLFLFAFLRPRATALLWAATTFARRPSAQRLSTGSSSFVASPCRAAVSQSQSSRYSESRLAHSDAARGRSTPSAAASVTKSPGELCNALRTFYGRCTNEKTAERIN